MEARDGREAEGGAKKGQKEQKKRERKKEAYGGGNGGPFDVHCSFFHDHFFQNIIFLWRPTAFLKPGTQHFIPTMEAL